jgi:hypothetical protein
MVLSVNSMATRQLKFACFSYSFLQLSAASAADDCLGALLSALERPTDVTRCRLLVTTDGRVATVVSGDSLYVQESTGERITYYRLNRLIGSVEAKTLPRDPWNTPITGRQTFPDAKSFYYPFYLTKKNEAAGAIGTEPAIACNPSTAFSALEVQVCGD